MLRKSLLHLIHLHILIAAKYPYGGLPSDTVQGAIDRWWAAYQAYWRVSTCSYNLTLKPDGESTGVFAEIQLTNGCSGGDVIYGTPYCPFGYTLMNNQCITNQDKEKNQGPPCESDQCCQ